MPYSCVVLVNENSTSFRSFMEVKAPAPLLFRRMSVHGIAKLLAAGCNWLPSALKRASDGTWNSYWWPGPFYATAAWLRLLEAAPWVCRADSSQGTDLPIHTAMDLAFAVEIAARWNLDARDGLCQALLEHQGKSGLWAPSRCLRVTDESCLSEQGGWGEVFADQNGLMTTATALRSLSAFCKFAPH